MIENLYLDLTEETKIYGKLFQACKAAAEELFRVDRVNELKRNLREGSNLIPNSREVIVILCR